MEKRIYTSEEFVKLAINKAREVSTKKYVSKSPRVIAAKESQLQKRLLIAALIILSPLFLKTLKLLLLNHL